MGSLNPSTLSPARARGTPALLTPLHVHHIRDRLGLRIASEPVRLASLIEVIGVLTEKYEDEVPPGY